MLAIIFGIIVTIFIFIIAFSEGWKYSLKKYWSITVLFVISTIFVYIAMSNTEFFNNVISKSNYPIYDKVVILLISMSIAILIDGIFASIIQKLYENSEINKYEKKHKIESYEYYRDILQTKSPAILSYCYNKRINVEDEVIAIILNLQKEKIIQIKDNKIIIIDDTRKLSEHEKYILNNNLYNKKFKKNFKQLLIYDLKKEGYVYNKSEEELNIVGIMELFMIWMMIYILVTIPIFVKMSDIGALVFFAYFLTFTGIPIYKVIQNKINPAVRNEKALELSGKLKGLKKYLVDYSIIKNNEVESINLYDEYIIYAIIFNIKGNLDKECKQMYINIRDNLIWD